MSDIRKYGRSWKKIRDKYIKAHPSCEWCLLKKSEEVHHIVPISRGGTHMDYNLMALCHDCHTEIHRREQRRENKKK